MPVRDVLRRVRPTVTQTHFDRVRRMQNLRDAFAVRDNVEMTTIILVDDVLTTGSTFDECARTLLEAGARSVSAVALVRG
jgi:predicted amidophosphoribosyltransferase